MQCKECYQESLGKARNFPVRFMNDVSAFAVGEAWEKHQASTDQFQLHWAQDSDQLSSANAFQLLMALMFKLGCVYHLPYKDNIADDYFSTTGLPIPIND